MPAWWYFFMAVLFAIVLFWICPFLMVPLLKNPATWPAFIILCGGSLIALPLSIREGIRELRNSTRGETPVRRENHKTD